LALKFGNPRRSNMGAARSDKMKKVLLVTLLVSVLLGCVKTDKPVTGIVLEAHEERTVHPPRYYLKLNEYRAVEVTFGVYLAVDIGRICTFSGTSADHPRRYSRVKCEVPQ
jgi:hypothetical protein